ncbi:MAG: coenzyme F420-0:L-glutamate ligase [Actinomycetota bacterium]|nr:coenzyme F420-0:L-glutamate ligase [Actinomycetota bacterium]
MEAIALKTELLRPGDDIVDVARRALDAAGLVTQPSDILAVAESPLAITQGRIVDIDTVRPGVLARVICRFFDFDSSLSTPYAAQVGMNEVGAARFVAAFIVAAPTRLVGRRGDFYRLAGRQVAWMYDIPGTMPPYTQHIILGPRDPDEVARRLARELGCGAAVVDANDMGKVEVLGTSAFLDRDLLIEAMRPNPQGNDDQQTPLVLVRP